MKVLVACEFSGVVRDAFIKNGHDAMSCDLLPADKPGFHYQGDVFDILNEGWDLMIAHPPCTYLCSSGLHWNKRVAGRDEKTDLAVNFVEKLLAAKINKIAIENPVGRIGTPDDIAGVVRFLASPEAKYINGAEILVDGGLFVNLQ